MRCVYRSSAQPVKPALTGHYSTHSNTLESPRRTRQRCAIVTRATARHSSTIALRANGSSPVCRASRQSPASHATRHPMPQTKTSAIPTAPAPKCRHAPEPPRPRRTLISHAAGMNPTKYPPVGPHTPIEPGEKTGNPTDPRRRYADNAAALCFGDRDNPTSNTARSWKVMGTSVPGIGKRICAARLTSKQPPSTDPNFTAIDCRVARNALASARKAGWFATVGVLLDISCVSPPITYGV